MKNLKIHIVGGRGKMGQWLKKLLEKNSLSVTVSGKKDNAGKNIKFSDIIFISVPISQVKKAILKVSKIAKKNCLIVDLSSVQTEAALVLEKIVQPSCAVHFLFGPNVNDLKKQKASLSSVSKNKKIDMLKDLLIKEGTKILEMDEKEHDKQMAYVQALNHFLNLVMANVLDNDIVKNISTPVFESQKKTMEMVLSQNRKMLAEIQLFNPYFLTVLEEFSEETNKIKELIKNNKLKKLAETFEKIRES